MTLSRRDFLKGGLMAGAYLSASQLFQLAACGADKQFSKLNSKAPILVVVQLNGGNDGLNMVIPYSQQSYFKLRPSIAIAEEKILKIDNQTGFHPAMADLHKLFAAEKVAVVQGVGYPNANRSHFRSIEIWQTAQPDSLEDTGWLGRYLDRCRETDSIFPAINLDPSLPKTFQARHCTVPTVPSLNDFNFKVDSFLSGDRANVTGAFSEIYDSFDLKRPHVELLRKAGKDAIKASDQLHRLAKLYKSRTEYPSSSFANSMKFIAQMITGGLPTSIYGANLDGFDTHTNQNRQQENLLRDLSKTIGAFQRDLEEHGRDQQVLTVIFSEFGRRVAENGGKGTDHGTAGPVLIVGSALKGGLYGAVPSLVQLDQGDLKHTTDFRSVYATILSGWFQADDRDILGHNFESLRFV